MLLVVYMLLWRGKQTGALLLCWCWKRAPMQTFRTAQMYDHCSHCCLQMACPQ